MSIRLATFEQLKDIFLERAGTPELPASSSVPNLVSALGDFIADSGFGWSDRIGTFLRSGFAVARDSHAKRLSEGGRIKSYIKNRKALLNVWHRFLLELDYEGSSVTGDLNPLQEALRSAIGSDRKLRRTAREIGVSPATLRSWVQHGRIPQARHYEGLERLEALADLSSGSLLTLIPKYRKALVKQTPPSLPYREKVREWSASRYRLKPWQIPAGHPLRGEWGDFARGKVAGKSESVEGIRPGGILSKALTTAGPKSWRTRQLREHWKSPGMLAKKWPEIIDGQWVPSASATFNALSQYFGWLLLDRESGGQGFSLDQITLGLVAQTNLLFPFIDWRSERSGQINGGHIHFVDMVLALLHPEDGFLPKRPDIGARVGQTEASWRAHCEKTYQRLLTDICPGLQEEFKKVGRSRKPFDPITRILELDRPLDAIVRAINKADADRPTTGGEHEAAWARDLALIALMASNPLRIINFIGLTYRPDNTGQLRQTATGEWRILIRKDEIKNTRFTARLGDYDQAVDPAVVPYIVRYLRTYRPSIGGARLELVFVSTDHPDREFDSLDRRVREFTRRYLEGGLGIGPHAFRHIVATHLVKTTNGNITLAALALHDGQETVERSYRHLLPKYVDRGRQESFGPSMGALRGCRKQPKRDSVTDERAEDRVSA